MSNTEKVIMYLDGELSQVEVLEFEEQLRSDHDLERELHLIQEIEQHYKEKSDEAFITSLEQARLRFLKKENNKKRLFLPQLSMVYRIAASIIILIATAATIFLVLNLKTSRYDTLFAEYYQPYQMDIATRSDVSIANNLQMAFVAYENKKYHEAITYFDKVLTSDNTMLIAYFYKGISYIECGDFIAALNNFEYVTKNPSNPYYVQTRWYLALTWLKLKKPDIAKSHLEWLVQNDRYYGAKASSILKKLNN